MDYKEYANIFKALSDETRLKIIEMLKDGEEKCACDLLENFKITQPTLSYHMKMLSDCGLVNARRDGAWMRYTLNKDTISALRGYFNAINIREDMKKSINCDC
ncbi:MAG: helix-turn-helix transcriptional regulator [Eubacteriaceae bacterium]|nr:helix-turn-helix transcriptional regulator [Eubacteriaceae bacterium]